MRSVYADLAVGESGTDTPDPEHSALVPHSGGTAPDCAAAPGPRAVKLAPEGRRYLGRKGGILIVEQANTDGTMPFTVLDAATGRTLFEDVPPDEGVDNVAVDGATVQIDFRRGFRAPAGRGSCPRRRSRSQSQLTSPPVCPCS